MQAENLWTFKDDTPNDHMRDRALYWISTDNSIKGWQGKHMEWNLSLLVVSTSPGPFLIHDLSTSLQLD